MRKTQDPTGAWGALIHLLVLMVVTGTALCAATFTDANESFQIAVPSSWTIRDETEGVDSVIRLVKKDGTAMITLGSQVFEGMSGDEAIIAILSPMVEEFRRLDVAWEVVEDKSFWSRFRRPSKSLHADSGRVRFRSIYIVEGNRVLSFDSWFVKAADKAEEEVNLIFDSWKIRDN